VLVPPPTDCVPTAMKIFASSRMAAHTTWVPGRVRIDRSGWVYPHWRERFYRQPVRATFERGVARCHKPAPIIREDKDQGVVFIGDVRVWGFVQSYPTPCGHPNIYSERWDAHFSPVDDRPERPSLARLDEIT